MSKYIDYGDDRIPIEEALEKMEEELGEKDEEISKYWEVLNKIKEYMSLNMRVKLNEEFGETMQYKSIYSLLEEIDSETRK